MMKDMLGREINVGDVIAYSNGNCVEIRLAVVIKINPKTVSSSKKVHSPSDVMVCSDQLMFSGQEEKLNKMIDAEKSKFDHTKPIDRSNAPRYRYMVLFIGDTHTNTMFVYVHRFVGASDKDHITEWKNLEQALTNEGFVFKGKTLHKLYQHLGDNVYSMWWWSNEWKVHRGYSSPYTSIVLRDLKSIGLEPFIGKKIDMHTFMNAVQQHIPPNFIVPNFFK